MIEASEFPPAIPFRRLFPWLRLFRGIGMALDFRKWALATMGLVLFAAGWGLLDRVFPGATGPVLPPPESASGVPAPRDMIARAAAQVAAPLLRPAGPMIGLFHPGETAWRAPHALLAVLWTLLVWGIFGGAIARLAMIEIGTGRRSDPISALRFSGRKLTCLIAAPLVPLIGVIVLSLVLAGIGLIYRVPAGFGAAVAGVLGFIALFLGLVMLWKLVWLGAGWPLMVAAVAAEAEDTFDALSRSHSYVFHRPWHFAFHAALAWSIGVVGFVLVGFAARCVLDLTAAGLAIGAPRDVIAAYFRPDAEPAGSFAAQAHRVWVLLVGLLIQSWAYSYFWSAAARIYLLMRHAVDGTPSDEIAQTEGHGAAETPRAA